MHLSKFTDFSLRVLIYLAGKPDDLSTIDEISTRYSISKEHLRKIVHHLAREGWIESRRGRGGGLCLAKHPRDIPVGAVVRGAEDSLALVECFEPGRNKCQIFGVCRLNGMLHEALDAFLTVLDGYTLHDIVSAEAGLFARLGLPTPVAYDRTVKRDTGSSTIS